MCISDHSKKYFVSNVKDQKSKNLVQFWLDSVNKKAALELLIPPNVRRTNSLCAESCTFDNYRDGTPSRSDDVCTQCSSRENVFNNITTNTLPNLHNNISSNNNSISNSSNDIDESTVTRRQTETTSEKISEINTVSCLPDKSSKQDSLIDDIYERLKKVRIIF